MADNEPAKDDGVHDLTAYVQTLLQQMVNILYFLILLSLFSLSLFISISISISASSSSSSTISSHLILFYFFL